MTWIEDLPTPSRIDAVMVTLHERIFLFGGWDILQKEEKNDVLEWTGEEWVERTTIGSKPCPRLGAAATFHSPTSFVLFGGQSGPTFLGDLWMCTIMEDDTIVWKSLQASPPPLPLGTFQTQPITEEMEEPPPRAFAALVTTNDGSMYLHGGVIGRTHPLDDFWRLDVNEPSWEKVHCEGTVPSASHHRLCLFQNVMWMVASPLDDAGGLQKDTAIQVYSYDVDLRKWRTKKVSMVEAWKGGDLGDGGDDGEQSEPKNPPPRIRFATTATPLGVFICGGVGVSNAWYKDAWLWLVKEQQWITLPDLPSVPRRDHACVVFRDAVLSVGGRAPRGTSFCQGASLSMKTIGACARVSPALIPFKEEEDEDALFAFTFGFGGHGQLGHGELFSRPLPWRLITEHKIQSISANGPWNVAITGDGGVVVWGQGVGSHPVRISGVRGRIAHVACGVMHALLLDARGHVWTLGTPVPGPHCEASRLVATPLEWGEPPSKGISRQRAGIGEGEHAWPPIVTQISCGSTHSLLLTNRGRVWALGGNDRGQLGAGGHVTDGGISSETAWETSCSLPKLVPTFGTTKVGEAMAICCGPAHSAVVTVLGKVFAFGGGPGVYAASKGEEVMWYPCEVNIQDELVIHVACGDASTMVLCKSGAVYGWGNAADGRLAMDDETIQSTPRLIPSLSHKGVQHLSLGGAYGHGHGIALLEGGTCLTWGSPAFGACGRDGYLHLAAPVPFPGKVVQVSAGAAHTVVVVDASTSSKPRRKEEYDDAQAVGPFFANVPNEVLLQIMQYLPARDLSCWMMTNRTFLAVCQDAPIWKKLYVHDAQVAPGIVHRMDSVASMVGWLALYQSWAEEQVASRRTSKHLQDQSARFLLAQRQAERRREVLRRIAAVVEAPGAMIRGIGGMMDRLALGMGLRKEVGALMVGLDAAGRTTILYKMKMPAENITTIPTIGFNVESFQLGKTKLYVWDIGGGDKIRPLWRHYFDMVKAVVFVVDSNDRERVARGEYGDGAREELHRMLNDEKLRGAVVLVIANKQDLPRALSVEQVSERMDLRLIRHTWNVMGCCGTTGEGVEEAFEWLANALAHQ